MWVKMVAVLSEVGGIPTAVADEDAAGVALGIGARRSVYVYGGTER